MIEQQVPGSPEEHDGRDDDRDALHRVAYGEGDGADAQVQHHVRRLVVQVVEEAAEGEQLIELGRADLGDGGVPGGRPRAALQRDRRRRAVQQRRDGDEAVQVDAVNVLIRRRETRRK